MTFKASDELLKLARKSRRRVAEPSVYEDYIELYIKLHGPVESPENEWARHKFLTTVKNTKDYYDHLTGTDINVLALCLQAVRSTLTDKRRDALRIIYPVDVVLMVILLAKLCGANTAAEIARFYFKHCLELQAMIDGIPSPAHILSPSSIKRVMRLLSADEINQLLSTYFKPDNNILNMLLDSDEQRERPEHADRHTIGFDGQEVTGSFRRGETSRRRKGAIGVTVFDCTTKQAIACKAVNKKNRESGAFLELLPKLGIANGIFYADALNTSAKVSNAILQSGGDFLFNLKKNAGSKELKIHVEAVFSREHAKGDKSAVNTRTYVQKGHGRIDQTTVNILPATLTDKRINNEHKGVKTLVEYVKESMYLKNGAVVKNVSSTRCYISSLEFTDENAAQIMCSILDYWSVEQHHSRLDDPRVFNQDDTQSCNFDYLSSLLGINKVAFNILSWIRQQMIKASPKKSCKPSFSMVQDELAQDTLFDTFRYIGKYFSQVNAD